MSNNIHVNDIGTRFTVVIVDDDTGEIIPLQDAATMQIVFKGPLMNSFSRAAFFTTNGSDGSIYYDTVSGDLSKEGDWEVQGQVSGPGYANSSQIREFKIKRKL